MFHDLDRLDWAAVEHAYGPADDVPGLLRRVRDDDRAALVALQAALVHHGVRFSATPLVVPFLIEIAGDATLAPRLRASTLALLTSCVAGSLSPVQGPDNGDGPFDDPGRRSATDVDIRRVIDVAAARAIVRVRSWLDDDDLGLRLQAAVFLSCFRSLSMEAELAPAIGRRLARESVASVRTALVFALGHVAPLDDHAGLRAVHDDPHEHDAVRTMAAIMLARRGVRHDDVGLTLAAAVAVDDDVNAVFCRAGLSSKGLAGDASRALSLFGSRAGPLMLPRLIERLRSVGDGEAVVLLKSALTAAFGNQRPPKAAALTSSQRELLVALVQNDEGFWQVGNALALLERSGLPSWREELARFVDVTFSHDPAAEAVRHAQLMLTAFHDAPRALDHLERALALRPDLGSAWLLKAFALRELDDVAGAMDSFRTATCFLEGDERRLARKNTAMALGDLGRRAEAVPFLEANAAEQPSSSAAWYDLALGLLRHRAFDRCLAAVDQCLAIQPDLARAHHTAACALAQRCCPDDDERSLFAVERALELNPALKAVVAVDDDLAVLRCDARFVALCFS
ncbi:MAG: tetratricopeptide repeat protein [Deltaproteobacteria bacterium]|nr:tetratricopeptide repeat protein [Deltaproteobacteria bacterium]